MKLKSLFGLRPTSTGQLAAGTRCPYGCLPVIQGFLSDSSLNSPSDLKVRLHQLLLPVLWKLLQSILSCFCLAHSADKKESQLRTPTFSIINMVTFRCYVMFRHNLLQHNCKKHETYKDKLTDIERYNKNQDLAAYLVCTGVTRAALINHWHMEKLHILNISSQRLKL